MSTQEAARKEIRHFFRQLNIMFYVFLISMLLFLLSVLVAVYFQGPLDASYTTFLYFGAPISGVSLIIMAQFLASGRFRSGREKEKLFEKMDAYRAGSALRMILLDGAAFVQLLGYVFTGDRVFLLLAVAVATVFMLYKPGLEKFIKELGLNEVEQRVMRDHSY